MISFSNFALVLQHLYNVIIVVHLGHVFADIFIHLYVPQALRHALKGQFE